MGENKIYHMIKIKKAKWPKFCKYGKITNPNWLRSIILEDEIYFPTPSELNDPAECKSIISDHSREEIESFLIRQFTIDNTNASALDIERIRFGVREFGTTAILDEMSKALNKILDKKYGVFCLSKRPDNLALWANYADNHRGYCLEFADLSNYANVYEVLYDKKLPFVLNPTIDPRQAEFLFTKTPEWAYEEEARILGRPGLKKFPTNLLESIILGKDMHGKHIDMIIDWCKARKVPLSVMKAKFNDRLHRMEYLTIE